MSKIAIAQPASAIDVGAADAKLVGAADASKVDAAFVIKERFLLTFQNLNYTVSTPKWMPAALTEGVPGQSKQILHNISGYARSGQTLAIVGSSGCGKTTLLDFLSDCPAHMGGVRSGAVLVNGKKMSKDFFKRHCAYVTQDDRLWGALTVRENLEMSASMYMSDADGDRAARVDLVLKQMGLESCQNTKAGNVLIKGCSGGQRKRLSVAMELMGAPAILFLDEPTSGLDSAAACKIMELLNRLANTNRMLLVCSIHQPASRIYYSFDTLMLLSMGRVAFSGSSEGAIQHFAGLGHTPQTVMNPADFLLDLTNPDFADREEVLKLVSNWSNDKTDAAIAQETAGADTLAKDTGAVTSVSFLAQVCSIMSRTFTVFARDPATYLGRFALFLQMSIIFGILYFNNAGGQASVMDKAYAVCWGMAIPSYMAICALPAFSFESMCYKKETKNGMYTAGAYTLATSLCQAPLVAVAAFVSSTPIYWMVGMNDDVSRYFTFVGLMFAFLYTVESLCIVIAILVPNFILGIGVVCAILSTFFVFNGIFAVAESIPWVLRWMLYISPHNYAYEGMLYTVYDGTTTTGFSECQTAQASGQSVLCFGTTGSQVLNAIPGIDSDNTLAKDFGALCGLALALRLVQYHLLNKISGKA